MCGGRRASHGNHHHGPDHVGPGATTARVRFSVALAAEAVFVAASSYAFDWTFHNPVRVVVALSSARHGCTCMVVTFALGTQHTSLHWLVAAGWVAVGTEHRGTGKEEVAYECCWLIFTQGLEAFGRVASRGMCA